MWVSAQQLKVSRPQGLLKRSPLGVPFIPQLLEATHPNMAGHAPSHRPFEEVARLPNAVSGSFMQEEVARLLNAVSGSWKWMEMQKENKMMDGVAACRAVLANTG